MSYVELKIGYERLVEENSILRKQLEIAIKAMEFGVFNCNEKNYIQVIVRLNHDLAEIDKIGGENKMMHHLKIELEPWLYPNSPNYELRVKLYFDGQEFGYQEIVPPDFMQSQFDQIWEFAGRVIKEKITGE